tara:strand:- start:229 stop:858 length:630 start_codon:yes stop_codon:yes gene_type:complete
MDTPLFSNARERRQYDDLADLYAIIKAIEHLEKAYAMDAIKNDEYTQACLKLIAQFKSTETALRKDGTLANTEEFLKAYQMDCPRAVERLLRAGVPATTLHNTSEVGFQDSAVIVAETTSNFITAKDALALDQRAVDEVQPLLSDLMDSLTRVPGLPANFGPTEKLRAWLLDLHAMRASDEISDNQARQLTYDLETAYTEFFRFLNESK